MATFFDAYPIGAILLRSVSNKARATPCGSNRRVECNAPVWPTLNATEEVSGVLSLLQTLVNLASLQMMNQLSRQREVIATVKGHVENNNKRETIRQTRRVSKKSGVNRVVNVISLY